MRLEAEERAKLEEMAEDRASLSDTVRRLIDDAYEVLMRARRNEAAERLINANVGDPPELDELKRLINEAASPGNLY
jgi:hypothetical protein